MRYAILSDVHGRTKKLRAILNDALAWGAQRIISLGDVGGDACVSLLYQTGVEPVFGNYEVSGWRWLNASNSRWVRTWSPLLISPSFLAAHAVPWFPDGLHNVEDADVWVRGAGRSWRSLFPYLTGDGDTMWRALAELESHDKAILFHGHTHCQTIWQWSPARGLVQMRERSIVVQESQRYIIGVGSVGMPEDGAWAAYSVYDSETGRVEQRAVSPF